MDDVLYIVMPAYNEEDNIHAVIKDWYPILSGKSIKSRLVIADKGSKDRTHSILLDMKNGDYPQLEIIETDSPYHGPKVIALYDYAINNGADYIFQTDSDGQTNPLEFNEFWELRKDYSGVFGDRIEREDGRERAFVERVVCFLLKLYFGVRIPDANAPFRLMRTDVVKKYLYKLPNGYNLPNIMMTTYFTYYHEKIAFRTVSFKPRQAGVNSINIRRIIKIGIKSLVDFHRLKKDMVR